MDTEALVWGLKKQKTHRADPWATVIQPSPWYAANHHAALDTPCTPCWEEQPTCWSMSTNVSATAKSIHLAQDHFLHKIDPGWGSSRLACCVSSPAASSAENSRKVPCSSLKLLHLQTAQMCTVAPSCLLQEKLTHKWRFNLLLYAIWLSHVASAFHCTAANTRTANPCLTESAGIGARCGSAGWLAAAWRSCWSSKDRAVRECVGGNPGLWPLSACDHLMKALEGVQSGSGATHWRYLPPMLPCTFQEGRKTAQGNVDTVI